MKGISGKVKIIIIVIVVFVLGLSIFNLAKFIISKSYDSGKLVETEEDVKAPKEEIEEDIKEIQGVHGNAPVDVETKDNVKLERVKRVLTAESSPYNSSYETYSATVTDSTDGKDTIVTLFKEDSTVLKIYCNSIDHAPYMFVKMDEFSEEEDSFYKSLGNGEKGTLEDGSSYWVYK